MKNVSGGHTQQGNAHRACVRVCGDQLLVHERRLVCRLQLLVVLLRLLFELRQDGLATAFVAFGQLILGLHGPARYAEL